jgi:hypothetical protein
VRRSSIRRLLLPETQQWLYYSIERTTDELLIHTIWGSARRRGPKLVTPQQT